MLSQHKRNTQSSTRSQLRKWLLPQLGSVPDARLILTAGVTLIASACLMNAQLSSVWSGANFLPSQAVMSVGLALAFNALVAAIILEVVNSGALNTQRIVEPDGTVRLVMKDGTEIYREPPTRVYSYHSGELAGFLEGYPPKFKNTTINEQ